MFTLSDALALPGAQTDAPRLLPALLAAQAEDGSWTFGPGAPAAARVAATLDAVLALVRFGGVPVVCAASEERDAQPRSDP